MLLLGKVSGWEGELDVMQGKAKTNWKPLAPLHLFLTSLNPPQPPEGKRLLHFRLPIPQKSPFDKLL